MTIRKVGAERRSPPTGKPAVGFELLRDADLENAVQQKIALPAKTRTSNCARLSAIREFDFRESNSLATSVARSSLKAEGPPSHDQRPSA
jgi:hypothetical protein